MMADHTQGTVVTLLSHLLPQDTIMKTIHLFCYGTLQSPLVMKSVTGHVFPGKKATLENWVRYRVRQTEYPGIVPQQNASVPGIVFSEIDEETLRKLDLFEGEKYERVPVEIFLEDGSKGTAEVYSIRRDCRDVLSNEAWDFDRFLEDGLRKFISWFVEDRRDLFDRGDL